MIRPIEPSDRSAILSLQQYLEYSDPDLVDAAIAGPFFGAVAVEQSRPAGYAIGFPAEPTRLLELVVDHDVRRQGHGRSLVDAIASKTAHSIVVLTPAKQQVAREFYRNLGFEYDDRIPEFYDDGADALRFFWRP